MSEQVEQAGQNAAVEPEVEQGGEINSRQRAFVRCLLVDPKRNGTEAALQAGYGNGNRDSARRVATYLLADPRVREEIARREAAADTSALSL